MQNNSNEHTNEKLLTRKEAAQLLRIGLSTLDYTISDAELPRIRIGKAVRILLSDVNVYVQQKRQGGKK